MIDYLEQLEHDLVVAIDRREHARAPVRRHPRIRLDLVAAAVAVAAALALILALGSGHDEERSVTRPTTPTVTNPKPIPKGTPLGMSGGLRRTGPTTWSGPMRGMGVGGVLTLTGTVDMRERPCCERPGGVQAQVLQFRWRTPRGVLGGCVVNSLFRRPYGRFVWDGPGRVTIATGAFARYRGRAVGFGGETKVALTSRARIVFGQHGRQPARC